jgi:hypothetical protein
MQHVFVHVPLECAEDLSMKQPLVPFSLRISADLHQRISKMAASCRLSPAEFARNLLDEATRKAVSSHATTGAVLPEDAVLRLAHAILFTEMSVEVFLSDREDLADAFREKAAARLSALLGKRPDSAIGGASATRDGADVGYSLDDA